jgi:hypothetical protein
METLPDQFRGALARIELGEKHARVIAAHTEIRGYLEADERLWAWGVDTVLIGSYARQTAIYPGKDVDVFTKLTKLDTSVDPNTVFEAVYAVLVAKYGERAEPQSRSIKITFPIDGEEDFADLPNREQHGRDRPEDPARHSTRDRRSTGRVRPRRRGQAGETGQSFADVRVCASAVRRTSGSRRRHSEARAACSVRNCRRPRGGRKTGGDDRERSSGQKFRPPAPPGRPFAFFG